MIFFRYYIQRVLSVIRMGNCQVIVLINVNGVWSLDSAIVTYPLRIKTPANNILIIFFIFIPVY